MRVSRRQHTAELMGLLERGPHLSLGNQRTITREEAESQIRNWIQTWVAPAVEALVPEVREELARRAASQIIVNAKERQ